jgi:hypothetical protein
VKDRLNDPPHRGIKTPRRIDGQQNGAIWRPTCRRDASFDIRGHEGVNRPRQLQRQNSRARRSGEQGRRRYRADQERSGGDAQGEARRRRDPTLVTPVDGRIHSIQG